MKPIVMARAISLSTAFVTLLTFGIAITTPPISGPFCVEGCIAYPFTEIAARFPRDYLWMYPALVLTLLYVAFTASFWLRAPQEKKLFVYLGLSFAIMSATLLFADYFIQLTIIQPSVLQKEGGLALWTQYNPHGIFIALEEAGYLLMSVSFLCLAPLFTGDRLSRTLRWSFLLGFLLVLVDLIAVNVVYGAAREYRFEVAAISIDWLVLIITGALSSIWFKRSALSTEPLF